MCETSNIFLSFIVYFSFPIYTQLHIGIQSIAFGWALFLVSFLTSHVGVGLLNIYETKYSVDS